MLYQVLYNRSNLHFILVLDKIDNSTKNKEVHKTSFHSRCHAVTSLFNDIVTTIYRPREIEWSWI